MKSKGKTTESKAMSGKSCMGELALALGMLAAMGAFFAWAMVAPELMTLPVILGAMVITAAGLVVVARKVHQSEQGVVEAGDVAEEEGGDPVAPVTDRARSGCGTAFAMLVLLGVCGALVCTLSMAGGA